MNLVWFQNRHNLSWHAVVPNRGLVWKSLCGRVVETVTMAERGTGKSCETCLRIVARMAGE